MPFGVLPKITSLQGRVLQKLHIFFIQGFCFVPGLCTVYLNKWNKFCNHKSSQRIGLWRNCRSIFGFKILCEVRTWGYVLIFRQGVF